MLDDFTMPDWCFLDDADPDWDAACEQINESEYHQFDVNVAWDLNDRWTLTSITGLSDFESHGITDWVMLGTEARHNDVESDVVYQELQLNADVRSVRPRDRPVVFPRGRLRQPRHGLAELRSARNERVSRRRRTATASAVGSGPERPVRDRGHGRLQDSRVDRRVRESSTWHITDRLNLTPGVRYALDEKDVTETRFPANDFVPFGGAPSTPIYASRRLGQHRLAAHARLRDHRQPHALRARRRKRFAPAPTATTSLPRRAATRRRGNRRSGRRRAFTPPERCATTRSAPARNGSTAGCA